MAEIIKYAGEVSVIALINNIKNGFAKIKHVHAISDIESLQDTLDNKSPSTHTHPTDTSRASQEEFNTLKTKVDTEVATDLRMSSSTENVLVFNNAEGDEISRTTLNIKSLSAKANNFKDGDDLPSTYPVGEYIFFSNNPSVRFNNIQYCTIRTIKGYSATACMQYLYPYNTNKNEVWYRQAFYNTDAWDSWRKLIDSENIGSYAPTKTGVGASGNWGINITGSASTLSGLTSTVAELNHTEGVTSNIQEQLDVLNESLDSIELDISNLGTAAYTNVANSIEDSFQDTDVASVNLVNEIGTEFANFIEENLKNKATSFQGILNGDNGSSSDGILNESESTVVASFLMGDFNSSLNESSLVLLNKGSDVQPVYFANGFPMAIDHTIEASVPSNAKFTDTTYEVATETTDGLMSSENIIKLNGIESGANKTVIDSFLSSTSENPVQNKVINEKFDSNLDKAIDYAGNMLTLAKDYSDSNLADAKAYADNIRMIPVITIRSENGINFTGSYNKSWNCNLNACFMSFQSEPLDNSELTININNNGDYTVSVPEINGNYMDYSSENFKFYIGREYLFIFDGSTWRCLTGVSLDVNDIDAISYRKNQILTVDEKEIARNNIYAEEKGLSAIALSNSKEYTDEKLAEVINGTIHVKNADEATHAISSNSANKLNTNAGSTTQPVYFSNGVPVKTTHTLEKSVPADAKFTDTVYTHPTSSGNKHIPSGGSSGQILRWSADGTAVWGADNNTTYSVVTAESNGLMSPAMLTNLNNVNSACTEEITQAEIEAICV